MKTLLGEAMMSVYYVLAVPLSIEDRPRLLPGRHLVGHRLHARGARSRRCHGRRRGPPLLILISHLKSIARHAQVPGHLYGQARRVLRDKVQAHDIHIGGAGLDLGSRDERGHDYRGATRKCLSP